MLIFHNFGAQRTNLFSFFVLFLFLSFDELATFITTHQDYNTLSSKKLDTTQPYCKEQTSNRDNPLLQTNLAKQLKQQKTTGEKISPIQNSSCIKNQPRQLLTQNTILKSPFTTEESVQTRIGKFPNSHDARSNFPINTIEHLIL